MNRHDAAEILPGRDATEIVPIADL